MTPEPFKERYIFQDLPDGFRFPDRYVSLISGRAPLPDLEPWWFLAENRRLADFWRRTLQEQYPSRILIPIAKRDDWGEHLTCFKGEDSSGNPAVWEPRGTWTDFEAWLRQAERDAAEFKADDANRGRG